MERNLILCQVRGMERFFNNLNEWKVGCLMMVVGDGLLLFNGYESWKLSLVVGVLIGDQLVVGLMSDGDVQKCLFE